MKRIINYLEQFLEYGGIKKNILCLVLSGIALLINLAFPDFIDLTWVAIILCGVPIIIEAIIGLGTKFDIKADVLVSIALIASLLVGEYFAAGEIAFIMQIGGLLEELTVSKARAGIENLVNLTPQNARIIENNKERLILASDVDVGAHIRVLPGESIPVDGKIIAGQTSINQAVMTGESLPVDKGVGDDVSSGTVNQFGTFDMIASKKGEDSSIQRMIRLVQNVDASKAKIVSLADRFATWIIVIALSVAFLTWIFTGEIIRSVTILVVFCPCSLVLATPTAIMAAVSNATKHGFLVREGDALERLAQVDRICFDKTGTLTLGLPKVIEVVSVNENYNRKELYRLCASIEKLSEHPLGKAVVRCFNKEFDEEIEVPEGFKMLPGKGVEALIECKKILAGNLCLLTSNKMDLTSIQDEAQHYLNQGCTLIYVAVANKVIGLIALGDQIRANMSLVMTKIQNLDVEPVLLTGDNQEAAMFIASQLNIKNVKAKCLPQDKLDFIEESQKNDYQVAMIGDGVNDALALRKAYVGIAMGGIGSDIAVEAADIALVDDQIDELPHLLFLSKKMMKTIKLNITFSMTLNFIAIVLAITGILNPIAGALVHNCGSVLVIINSALLMKWRMKE